MYEHSLVKDIIYTFIIFTPIWLWIALGVILHLRDPERKKQLVDYDNGVWIYERTLRKSKSLSLEYLINKIRKKFHPRDYYSITEEYYSGDGSISTMCLEFEDGNTFYIGMKNGYSNTLVFDNSYTLQSAYEYTERYYNAFNAES